MAFSFIRGNPAEYARQLSLTSYEPALVLEDLVTGIDNVRHDVFLSPKFSDAARLHIFKLVAKHGNVEELAEELTPGKSGSAEVVTRAWEQRRAPKPVEGPD